MYVWDWFMHPYMCVCTHIETHLSESATNTKNLQWWTVGFTITDTDWIRVTSLQSDQTNKSQFFTTAQLLCHWGHSVLPGQALLALCQKWFLGCLPLPGTALPSAAPQQCPPGRPTVQPPPSGPVSGAAARSPERQPRWVYVQTLV